MVDDTLIPLIKSALFYYDFQVTLTLSNHSPDRRSEYLHFVLFSILFDRSLRYSSIELSHEIIQDVLPDPV